MGINAIPIWALFVGTILIVLAAIEGGYLLGRFSHRRSEEEKESPVSAIAGTILGLVAFILAFTFGIVYGRYDARKELVRGEAKAIQTTWMRSELLPESNRTEAKRLIREYTEKRLDFAQSRDLSPERVKSMNFESQRILSRLWEIAITNTRGNMNSDYASLYIEAINEMIAIRASLVAVGIQGRMPKALWFVLYAITVLGMMGVGYQTGIAGSKRSMARPILAVSFALVIVLIASLDNPIYGIIDVSQQPLIDLLSSMEMHYGGMK